MAARPALQLLASLYGLSRVERHLDFYLAAGALGTKDRAALRMQVCGHHTVADVDSTWPTQINALCGTLAQDGAALAIQLCDAFAIPDHLLRAPIAFDWKTMA